jgi:hypothetical protein
MGSRKHNVGISRYNAWTVLRLRRLSCLLVVLSAYCALLAWSPLAYSASRAQKQLIAQTIRYHQSEAGEVYLVWGLDGWKTVPESQRPAGTIVHDWAMYSPMVWDGSSFKVNILAPLGTTVDYAFFITKKRSGEPIEVWDTNGAPKRDYHTVVLPDQAADVYTILQLDEQGILSTNDLMLFGGGGVLLVIALTGGTFWLRRRFRNPFLDF